MRLATTITLAHVRPSCIPLEPRRLLAVGPVGATVQMNDVTLPLGGATSIDAWSGGMVGFFTNRLRRFDLNGEPAGASIAAPASLNPNLQEAQLNCDAFGGSVLVWRAATAEAGLFAVKAQRYSPQLVAIGAEIAVGMTSSTNGASAPDVNVAADGSFAVGWTGSPDSTGVFLRRYGSDGLALGDTQIVYHDAAQISLGFSMDGTDDGSLALVWSHKVPGMNYLYSPMLQLIGPGGALLAPADTVVVNGGQYPDVRIAGNGNVAVAWGVAQLADVLDYIAPACSIRIYNATGVPVTDPIAAIMGNSGARLAVDGNNIFTIVISDTNLSGSFTGIYARQFDTTGAFMSGVFRMNDPVANVHQYCRSLVGFADRTFFAWVDVIGSSSPTKNAYLRGIKPVISTSPQLASASFDVNRAQSTPDKRVVLTFDTSVWANIGLGMGTFTNQTDGQTIDPRPESTQNALSTTFNLSRSSPYVYADGNWHVSISRFCFSDRWGTPLANDIELDFFVLAGDANRDRRVDTTDFNILAANFGTSGKVFTQGNFDYSSTVSSMDFNLLSTNYGRTLPAPSAVAAPLFSKLYLYEDTDETISALL